VSTQHGNKPCTIVDATLNHNACDPPPLQGSQINSKTDGQEAYKAPASLSDSYIWSHPLHSSTYHDTKPIYMPSISLKMLRRSTTYIYMYIKYILYQRPNKSLNPCHAKVWCCLSRYQDQLGPMILNTSWESYHGLWDHLMIHHELVWRPTKSPVPLHSLEKVTLCLMLLKHQHLMMQLKPYSMTYHSRRVTSLTEKKIH
jgi:hypothetical protein